MTTTLVRRRWAIGQVAVVVFAFAAAAFFTFVRPSGVSQVQRFTPTTLGDQPSGAVVMGREDGLLAVGLAVAPRKHGLLVVATVFGQSGAGQTGLAPKVTITEANRGTSTASATACTAGCYQSVFATTALPRSATISFADGSHLTFSLPGHGPTAQAANLVTAAAAEYRQIHSMVTHESLGSSLNEVAYTNYFAVAPSSMRFQVKGGEEAIFIGRRRWDRNPGGRWQESAQTPIDPIAAYWTPLVQDATLMGSATVQGRPVWVISFADPQTPGFFTIWVDKADHRTLELEMTAAAHFMHHSYDDFNAALKVTPPITR